MHQLVSSFESINRTNILKTANYYGIEKDSLKQTNIRVLPPIKLMFGSGKKKLNYLIQ